MWLSYTENPKIVEAIYKENIPLLENILLQEMKIVYGEDIQCFLRFDLKVLPKPMPTKWSLKNVDTIQVDFALISAEIILFNTNECSRIGNLDIRFENGLKKMTFTVNKKDIFIITCKWINIRSLSGYLQEKMNSFNTDSE